MPIQDGSPKYSKQYKTTLNGKTRKAVELYMAENELCEAVALRELIQKGLMALSEGKSKHPFFGTSERTGHSFFTTPKQQ